MRPWNSNSKSTGWPEDWTRLLLTPLGRFDPVRTVTQVTPDPPRQVKSEGYYLKSWSTTSTAADKHERRSTAAVYTDRQQLAVARNWSSGSCWRGSEYWQELTGRTQHVDELADIVAVLTTECWLTGDIHYSCTLADVHTSPTSCRTTNPSGVRVHSLTHSLTCWLFLDITSPLVLVLFVYLHRKSGIPYPLLSVSHRRCPVLEAI